VPNLRRRGLECPDGKTLEGCSGGPARCHQASGNEDDYVKTYSHIPPGNIMDLLLDAICVVDARGCFVFVSAACERIFGYPPEEMIGRPMIDFVFHEDRTRTLQAAKEIVDGQPQPHFENRYVRKDGQIVHIMWSARWSEADQVRVAVARDVTERKRADTMQAALYAISEAAHSAGDLIALFEQIHQIIGGLLPAVNFFITLYDKSKGELTYPYYVDQYDQAPTPQKLDSAALSAEVIRTGQVLLYTPDSRAFPPGQVRPALGRDSLNWLGVPLHAKKGVIGALVVKNYCAETRYTQKDIELLQFVSTQIATAIERKQMDIWLQHIARHDPLTDLPNRALFHDRLQTSLRRAKRNQTLLSLLYIDLDKFKQINDTLGHPIGDLLLQEVAHRLKQCVRESDTVGRIGGDEFLVLLHDISLPENARMVAEKIRIALCRHYDLADHRVHVSPSIGVALYPEHGDDYQQLIRYADEAMYDAKKNGGNRFR
jgi:diguanylate cyclase (GGDEF)-like protein/PAS domain S-box-containing protein